jgi:hypothetical protein
MHLPRATSRGAAAVDQCVEAALPEPRRRGAASLFLRVALTGDVQGNGGGTLARLGSEESRLYTADKAPLRRAVFAAAFLLLASLHAAPPVVTSLDVRALQIGKVNTLTFTGTDLLPNPRVLTTARLARQTVKEGAKPNQVTIEIELAPGSQPGFENYWLVTDHGVSARGLIATDPLEQKPFVEKVESLPVALHGALNASQVREVTFPGKAGQQIICEIEAQRLESKLRPTLSLFAPDNKLVQFSLPMAALRGDTRLEAKLPVDGTYRLQFHDLQYAATGTGQYRLKIGHWSYADLAFPSTVQRGATTEVQLIGRPGEVKTVRLSPNTDAAAVPAPWPDPATASGPQVAVRLSDMPELVEDRTGSAPQALSPMPVAVNGRIDKPNEEDAYEVTVVPETDVDFEVSADVLGSPMDAELELRDAKGARVAINDDTPAGPDPRLTYKVPKDVTKVTAVVRDVSGNSGARCIYRLQATAKAKEKTGSFSLTITEDSQTLEPGRPSVLKVEAIRAGYDGPINLAFEHLPEGVQVSGQNVPAQATARLLTLSAAKPCPELITTLRGEGQKLEVLARFDSPQLGQIQPWLANTLALASAVKTDAPFSADWSEAAAARKIPLGGKLTLPVKCVRPVGHDGPVRLTLITSQARLYNKDVVDATKMLREEKATFIEDDKPAQAAFDALTAAQTALAAAQKTVAANKDEKAAEALTKKVEEAQAAVEKAQAKATEAAEKAKNDVEYPLTVPAELPEIPHQMAIKAELLKRNRTTVEAVVYIPVRDFPVVNPIAIKLDPPAPIKIAAKAPTPFELTGKIERLEGSAGDVTVTLAELPAGIAGTLTATVKADATDFKFPLTAAPTTKPGDYPTVKISATGKPFGNLQVKTRDTLVALTVVAAEPPAEPAASAKP